MDTLRRAATPVDLSNYTVKEPSAQPSVMPGSPQPRTTSGPSISQSTNKFLANSLNQAQTWAKKQSVNLTLDNVPSTAKYQKVAAGELTSGGTIPAHGNGPYFQKFAGTSAAGDVAVFDINGNIVDGGAPPIGPPGQGFNWRGAYSSSATYAPYDCVSYDGSSYVCTAATSGNAPTDSAYWSLLAEGDAGAAANESILVNSVIMSDDYTVTVNANRQIMINGV